MTELGSRLASGEPAAFAELYDLCADRLHHYLAIRLGSRADADDVLQESFVRLARMRKKLARVESPTAYLFTIARNEAMRFLARRRAMPGAGAVLPPTNYFANRPSAAWNRAKRQRRSPRRWTGCRSNEREVVELKSYGGLTLAEIARVTAAPPGTVATRWRTAVAKLREILARQCHE